MGKQKMIIDCDTGVDDAEAIIMALSRPEVEVVAITCVSGNIDIENVCRNTLRVLKMCNRLDIPVYRGCCKSIIKVDEDASEYHGKDGMGDHPNPPEVDMSLIQKEHAVEALLSLSKKFNGEIDLVTFAPLTNLAIALRLDPDFSLRLKTLVIMGGNIEGKGNNTMSIASEFNFKRDPEAAYMILHEMKCSKINIPWELCLSDGYPFKEVEKCLNGETEIRVFLKKITKNTIKGQHLRKIRKYRSCDAFAMSVAIDRSIALETEDLYATLELRGQHTRGQLVCDWRHALEKPPNITIVKKFDATKSFSLWANMLSCRIHPEIPAVKQ